MPPKAPTKQCPHCLRDFNSSNLPRHVRSFHRREYKPKYRGDRYLCVPCRKTFSTSNRATHMKTHHDGEQVEIRRITSEEETATGEYSDSDTDMSDLAQSLSDLQDLSDGIDQSAPTVVPSQEAVETEVLDTPVIAYVQDAEFYRKELVNHLGHLVPVVKDLSSSSQPSRLMTEITAYSKMLERSSVGYVMNADQYIAFQKVLDRSSFVSDADCRNTVVVCDHEQARCILEQASPLAPLVIRAGDDQRPRVTIMEYCEYLQTKTSVDVHFFNERADKDSCRQPKAIEPSEAVAAIYDSSIRPVNLLNLEGFRQNAVPRCLEGIKHYNILTNVREHHSSAGRRDEDVARDLTASSHFQLLAKAGALHMPHRDADHVITTLEVEEGYKLWLMWPELSAEELQAWAIEINEMENLLASPRPNPIAITLGPGDILIQPQRRVHAPYSLSAVLMTGTKCWDSREMSEVPAAALEEQRWPNITNEDLTTEMRGKLEQIEKLWAAKNSYWEFGNCLKTYQSRLDALYGR